jgi:hypothetical protein
MVTHSSGSRSVSCPVGCNSSETDGIQEWNDECKGLCPFDFMVLEDEGNNHLQLLEQLEVSLTMILQYDVPLTTRNFTMNSKNRSGLPA